MRLDIANEVEATCVLTASMLATICSAQMSSSERVYGYSCGWLITHGGWEEYRPSSASRSGEKGAMKLVRGDSGTNDCMALRVAIMLLSLHVV